MGAPYTGAIDMWSLACVCAEMFLGLPLFPGVSQHNQLSRIVEMFGVPPDFLIEAKNGLKYFTLNSVSSIAKISPNSSLGEQALTSSGSSGSDAAVAIATATVGGGGVVVGAGAASPLLDTTPLPTKYSKYRLKTPEEYAAATNSAVPVLKKYLRYSRLDEVIMKCPVANRGKMTNEQKANEMMKRKCFLDFLKGLFNLNPFERWTAKQAAGHPFITNAPYIGRYVPEADRRAEERLTDFTRQMERLKLSQSIANSAVVASSPIRNLSRSKVPSNFETIPREGEDAHRHVDIPDAGETAFTLLKNRRQTEPVELNSSKVRGKDEQGRPQLRRGNPVHMKQSGGSTEGTFRSQPQSHQQQQQQQQQGQQISKVGSETSSLRRNLTRIRISGSSSSTCSSPNSIRSSFPFPCKLNRNMDTWSMAA